MKEDRAISKQLQGHNFISLFRSASHPREQIWFLVFSHLQEGKSPREVAGIIRVTRNTIYRWLRNFKAKGGEGLREQIGRRKKPLIAKNEREAFRLAVLDLQKGRAGGCITGKDVLRLMDEKYGIKCSQRETCSHCVRQSGLAYNKKVVLL